MEKAFSFRKMFQISMPKYFEQYFYHFFAMFTWLNSHKTVIINAVRFDIPPLSYLKNQTAQHFIL